MPVKAERLALPDGDPHNGLPMPYDALEALDHPAYWWSPAPTAWLLWLPGVGLADLSAHEVREPDGVITVRPSILVGNNRLGRAHGFLEAGIWRDA